MSIDIDEVFVTLLSGRTNVTNIVGTKIFPNRVPQTSSLPAVIIRRISGGPIPTIGGKSLSKRATFQVESWSAVSQEAARQLDLYVQEISGTRGDVGSWWIDRLTVNQDTDQDNPQIPIHADDLGLFCSFSEFTVFYKPG